VDALATETTPKAVQKHAATAAEIVALESMIPVLERRIVEAEPRIARATAAIREPRLIHEGATHAVEAAELAPLEIERRAHEAEAARLRAEAERSDEKAREVLQQMRAAANDKAWEYDVLAIVGVAADAIEAARQPRQAAE
jgi:hypothetical protein